MAEQYIRYKTATGRLVSCGTTQAVSVPGDETEVSVGDFPINPWASGQVWDEATRALVARPAPVKISRLSDLKTDPLFQPERDWIQANIPASRRDELQALIGSIVRKLLGVARWRNTAEAVRLAPDDAEGDE